jgi:hypothetical protein
LPGIAAPEKHSLKSAPKKKGNCFQRIQPLADNEKALKKAFARGFPAFSEIIARNNAGYDDYVVTNAV